MDIIHLYRGVVYYTCMWPYNSVVYCIGVCVVYSYV